MVGYKLLTISTVHAKGTRICRTVFLEEALCGYILDIYGGRTVCLTALAMLLWRLPSENNPGILRNAESWFTHLTLPNNH